MKKIEIKLNDFTYKIINQYITYNANFYSIKPRKMDNGFLNIFLFLQNIFNFISNEKNEKKLKELKENETSFLKDLFLSLSVNNDMQTLEKEKNELVNQTIKALNQLEKFLLNNNEYQKNITEDNFLTYLFDLFGQYLLLEREDREEKFNILKNEELTSLTEKEVFNKRIKNLFNKLENFKINYENTDCEDNIFDLLMFDKKVLTLKNKETLFMGFLYLLENQIEQDEKISKQSLFDMDFLIYNNFIFYNITYFYKFDFFYQLFDFKDMAKEEIKYIKVTYGSVSNNRNNTEQIIDLVFYLIKDYENNSCKKFAVIFSLLSSIKNEISLIKKGEKINFKYKKEDFQIMLNPLLNVVIPLLKYNANGDFFVEIKSMKLLKEVFSFLEDALQEDLDFIKKQFLYKSKKNNKKKILLDVVFKDKVEKILFLEFFTDKKEVMNYFCILEQDEAINLLIEELYFFKRCLNKKIGIYLNKNNEIKNADYQEVVFKMVAMKNKKAYPLKEEIVDLLFPLYFKNINKEEECNNLNNLLSTNSFYLIQDLNKLQNNNSFCELNKKEQGLIIDLLKSKIEVLKQKIKFNFLVERKFYKNEMVEVMKTFNKESKFILKLMLLKNTLEKVISSKELKFSLNPNTSNINASNLLNETIKDFPLIKLEEVKKINEEIYKNNKNKIFLILLKSLLETINKINIKNILEYVDYENDFNEELNKLFYLNHEDMKELNEMLKALLKEKQKTENQKENLCFNLFEDKDDIIKNIHHKLFLFKLRDINAIIFNEQNRLNNLGNDFEVRQKGKYVERKDDKFQYSLSKSQSIVKEELKNISKEKLAIMLKFPLIVKMFIEIKKDIDNPLTKENQECEMCEGSYLKELLEDYFKKYDKNKFSTLFFKKNNQLLKEYGLERILNIVKENLLQNKNYFRNLINLDKVDEILTTYKIISYLFHYIEGKFYILPLLENEILLLKKQYEEILNDIEAKNLSIEDKEKLKEEILLKFLNIDIIKNNNDSFMLFNLF